MNVDIPEKLVKRLRKAYDRTYGRSAKSVSDKGVVLAVLSDSLHPIDDNHLTTK